MYIAEPKSKRSLLVALKYMSEMWQPMPILNPNMNVYYKRSKSIIDELDQLMTISCNLFKTMLVWKDARLGIKTLGHILRTINKLMGSYNLPTKPESVCNEKMLVLEDYWEQLQKQINTENIVTAEEIFLHDGHPISFEMTCVNVINQLIYQYSSNALFVSEAVELSFSIVRIHHSRIQVNNIAFS